MAKTFPYIYPIVTICLFILLMWATGYMFRNHYISENFTSGTTHNVNLPLTTTTSCKNMCGPPGRCSITGTQCLSDIDCYGCRPNTSPDLSNTFLLENKFVIGDDDAGKKSYLAPMYSPLTHDISYNAKVMISDPYSAPPEAYPGFDVWTSKAADMREIYDFTYLPSDDTPYMSKYPMRYSVTGQFRNTGPFASNASLKPYYDSLRTDIPQKM